MTERILVYSDPFLNDAQLIKDYISNQLFSPQAAENLFSEIKAKLARLKDSSVSAMYPILDTPRGRKFKIRFFTVGNYTVTYRLLEGEVYVMRVQYSKRRKIYMDN